MQKQETDFTVHSDAMLTECIEQLTREERHVSTVRTRVHQRIEFIRSGGAGFGNTINEQLEQLEEEESAVSRQRRELHLVLDAALAEQHLRRVDKHADFLGEDPPPPFRNRDRVQVSVKYGALRGPDRSWLGFDARPAVTKTFLTYTLQRLGTDHVDIYRPGRLDANVPIEDTVGAIADLIKGGYVRYIGLSEVGPETLRRANAVHPISDLQIEYSLISRGIEDEIVATCRELGIGITAYGVLSRGPDIVPLVGARRRDRLGEALGALELELSEADLAAIERAVPQGSAAGARYVAQQMAGLDSERGRRKTG